MSQVQSLLRRGRSIFAGGDQNHGLDSIQRSDFDTSALLDTDHIVRTLTARKQFQALTEEDQEEYGTPELTVLDPPASYDQEAERRRENWLDWRAAPYPAARHSEYLFRTDTDIDGGPRIMLSAIMSPPSSMEEYSALYPSKTKARVEGRRAAKAGYTVREIQPAEESEGIWNVVHSSDSRQGRDIAPMFLSRAKDFDFPNYTPVNDRLYQNINIGVFSPDGQLAAYLLGYRIDDHVVYDEIMGHSDHFKFDVMYYLHFHFLKACLEQEVVPQCLHYGPWYSGVDPYAPTGGLNAWKRRTGFRPTYLIAASS